MTCRPSNVSDERTGGGGTAVHDMGMRIDVSDVSGPGRSAPCSAARSCHKARGPGPWAQVQYLGAGGQGIGEACLRKNRRDENDAMKATT
ncbi:hypothetical protein GCM10011415_01580 [Salipiger pallidus]|uniref:Uncharacterized protein n=1 Tax=Salipiger pallidus TaxID=1775170 RepID=A0A8J2ZGB1_9RHOB|nr:hypothetical protein GCM10011415_01580 [Salipiger pallidus]